MKYFVTYLFILLSVSSFAQTDFDSHLVAHWAMDGSAIDSSTNHINGKLHGVTFDEGVIGNAAYFNGSSDKIIISDSVQPSSISTLSKGSISLWFKYQNNSNTGDILPIFYYGEKASGTPQNSLIIEIGHSQNPANRRLYFTIINQGFCFDSRIILTENVWYHFVAVVGDDFNTGYLNGKEMTTRHYNLGSDETYHDFFSDVPDGKLMSIGYGRYGKNDNFFRYKGAIDDVRIYDKPLSANEVSELYSLSTIEVNPYPNCPLPTYEAVKYGPFERNEIDFWKADTDEPAPVVLYIHGGGFINGNRLQVRTNRANDVKNFLANGISVASISYRLKSPNIQNLYSGTRLDTIILDCARSVQFLKYMADEWNIDKNRIGAYGGSAGGGASLWIGTHNDLADTKNPDPVLKESSRIKAVGHLNSQATYNWPVWPAILEMDSATVYSGVAADDVETWQMPREEMGLPEGLALGAFLDMYNHLTTDDPPIYTQNRNENVVPGNIIHHPRHSIAIKNKCDEIGVECTLALATTPAGEYLDFVPWMIEKLGEEVTVSLIADNRSSSGIEVYPNPATSQLYYNTGEHKFVRIGIFSLSGQNLFRHNPANGDSINISELPAGVYLIKAIDKNKQRYIQRFIKN
ncbi:LamG-like jellyroll fold domain-containing protein [Bacteroidota bacterium]